MKKTLGTLAGIALLAGAALTGCQKTPARQAQDTVTEIMHRMGQQKVNIQNENFTTYHYSFQMFTGARKERDVTVAYVDYHKKGPGLHDALLILEKTHEPDSNELLDENFLSIQRLENEDLVTFNTEFTGTLYNNRLYRDILINLPKVNENE